MASKMKVVNIYRPRVRLGNPVQKEELCEALRKATALEESVLKQVIHELGNLIVQFQRDGRVVSVDGLGTFTPDIDLHGKLDVKYCADPALTSALSMAQLFKAEIFNRENIGKGPQDFVQMWNIEHPEDPVNTD